MLLETKKKKNWLSRIEGNTFLASLKLSSESQKHTACKKIKCNAACGWRQCVLRRGNQSRQITFETSPSLCDAARTTMWGVTGGRTRPEVLKCEPVQDRAHAKDKERRTPDHFCSKSHLQSEVGPWLKTTFIRMNRVCLDYTFHANDHIRDKCLCAVLITPQ